jgi:hypothetical protein
MKAVDSIEATPVIVAVDVRVSRLNVKVLVVVAVEIVVTWYVVVIEREVVDEMGKVVEEAWQVVGSWSPPETMGATPQVPP